MPLLTGVIPPLVTPLKPDLSVDLTSLGRVVEHLVDAGVHGLFLLGTSGEVMFHGPEARRAIVAHAAKVAGGRLPILVGAIDATTDRVIAHARDAAAAGADAIVVTAPFYTRTSQGEILDHFRYVRDGVELPVIAYDIPVCVHAKLERETTVTLAREGTVTGLKDSSGDDGNFRFVLSDTSDLPDFFAMTGSEVVVDSALAMGAHGVVPGLGNVDPAGYVRLWRHAQAGDHAAARAEQERLCRLFEIVHVASGRASRGSAGVGAFKAALHSLGIIEHAGLPRPGRALNTEEVRVVEAILRDTGVLT